MEFKCTHTRPGKIWISGGGGGRYLSELVAFRHSLIFYAFSYLQLTFINVKLNKAGMDSFNLWKNMLQVSGTIILEKPIWIADFTPCYLSLFYFVAKCN